MKRFKSLAVVAATLLGCAYFILVDSSTSIFSFRDAQRKADEIAVKAFKPEVKYGMIVNGLEVTEDFIKRNQRFTDLLSNSFVSPEILKQLATLPSKIFDFRKIAFNKKYTLISHADSLRTVKALVYEPNPIDYVIFHFEDSLHVEVCQREVVTLKKNITGTIQSSLSETIEGLGITNELTNKFVDIFGWQVDFQHLQKGDRFKLIYEENQVEGKTISIGKIEGIYFEHFGRVFYGLPFDQGEGMDYFDEDGKSLRKALLKYPIEFSRISSRYNLNRFHPVAKVYRAHLGTDFAAPTGTPIRTVGDGIVVEAQFSSNNGNYVKIRHNGTYTTQYLHMSKIAAGIRAGNHVKQGETIGYVGSTGLATGPHLCYRFWKNGVQVDALRVDLPPSQPVKEDMMEKFNGQKTLLLQKLDQIAFPEKEETVMARS